MQVIVPPKKEVKVFYKIIDDPIELEFQIGAAFWSHAENPAKEVK